MVLQRDHWVDTRVAARGGSSWRAMLKKNRALIRKLPDSNCPETGSMPALA